MTIMIHTLGTMLRETTEESVEGEKQSTQNEKWKNDDISATPERNTKAPSPSPGGTSGGTAKLKMAPFFRRSQGGPKKKERWRKLYGGDEKKTTGSLQGAEVYALEDINVSGGGEARVTNICKFSSGSGSGTSITPGFVTPWMPNTRPAPFQALQGPGRHSRGRASCRHGFGWSPANHGTGRTSSHEIHAAWLRRVGEFHGVWDAKRVHATNKPTKEDCWHVPPGLCGTGPLSA